MKFRQNFVIMDSQVCAFAVVLEHRIKRSVIENSKLLETGCGLYCQENYNGQIADEREAYG